MGRGHAAREHDYPLLGGEHNRLLPPFVRTGAGWAFPPVGMGGHGYVVGGPGYVAQLGGEADAAPGQLLLGQALARQAGDGDHSVVDPRTDVEAPAAGTPGIAASAGAGQKTAISNVDLIVDEADRIEGRLNRVLHAPAPGESHQHGVTAGPAFLSGGTGNVPHRAGQEPGEKFRRRRRTMMPLDELHDFRGFPDVYEQDGAFDGTRYPKFRHGN
jgi:hypothetical protein